MFLQSKFPVQLIVNDFIFLFVHTSKDAAPFLSATISIWSQIVTLDKHMSSSSLLVLHFQRTVRGHET